MAYVSPKPIHLDPHTPVLLNSPKLEVSIEQQEYIRFILGLACSDSRFQQKSFDALMYVLTNGNTPVPNITSINPTTAAIGDPTFTLHVVGERFDDGAQIVFAGQVEPTTRVSESELTTGVNMDTWFGPDEIPVTVQNPNGTMSNTMTFTFTESAPLSRANTMPPEFKNINPNLNPNVNPDHKAGVSTQTPPVAGKQ